MIYKPKSTPPNDLILSTILFILSAIPGDVASILINGGKDKNINLILKREPTEIEWLNINDALKHLKG